MRKHLLFLVFFICMTAVPEARKAVMAHRLRKPLEVRSLNAVQSDAVLNAGIFTVYYDTAGSDAVPDQDTLTLAGVNLTAGADGVPDYPQYTAAACDSVYRCLTGGLGYSFPSAHIGVRMLDIGDYYSFAETIDSVIVDNDMVFSVPFTLDIQGAYQVALAHELFHIVQFGYHQTPYNFFHEASAAWMEEKIFGDVNDYIQYLESGSYSGSERNIFLYPDYPLDAFNAFMPGNYDKAVWPMFIDQRYSPDPIRFAWEGYAADSAAESHAKTIRIFGNALRKYDSTLDFQTAFYAFGERLFYTGARAPLHQTFEDAALYPEVRTDTLGDVVDSPFVLRPLSMRYLFFQSVSAVDSFDVALAQTGACTAGVYLCAIQADTLVSDTPAHITNADWGRFKLSPQSDNYLCLMNASAAAVNLRLTKPGIGVEQGRGPDPAFALNVFPNPFHAGVKISYFLPNAALNGRLPVNLSIFDISGRILHTREFILSACRRATGPCGKRPFS
jgi:hypothetical protein